MRQKISIKEVSEWRNHPQNKKKRSFLQFDIRAFYPSISKELLLEAITWAKDYSYISDCAVKIVMNARRTILFDGEDVWIKKTDGGYDVSMGSFDGAECCELVGLFLLSRMIQQEIFQPEEVILYRDDGLSAIEGNGHVLDSIRKRLIALFKSYGLNITCESNLKKVNFLDVSMDLNHSNYQPFIKRNCKLRYVAKGSNHPANILENIPLNVNRRLQSIASDRTCFESQRGEYQRAIENAGYATQLKYDRTYDKKNLMFSRNTRAPDDTHGGKQARKRDIMWFNPPYNSYCSTKVGRQFRDLIQKYFSKGNIIGRLFNKNRLKLSYSCL